MKLNFSMTLLDRLQALDQKVASIQIEITELTATVSQVVTSQEERIRELESWINPNSHEGSAICNSYSDE